MSKKIILQNLLTSNQIIINIFVFLFIFIFNFQFKQNFLQLIDNQLFLFSLFFFCYQKKWCRWVHCFVEEIDRKPICIRQYDGTAAGPLHARAFTPHHQRHGSRPLPHHHLIHVRNMWCDVVESTLDFHIAASRHKFHHFSCLSSVFF